MSLNDHVREFTSRMEGIATFLDGGAPNEKQFAKIMTWVGDLRAALAAAPQPAGTAVAVGAAPASSQPTGGADALAWWESEVLRHLEDNDVISLDPETAADVLSKIPVDLNADPEEVALRAVRPMA